MRTITWSPGCRACAKDQNQAFLAKLLTWFERENRLRERAELEKAYLERTWRAGRSPSLTTADEQKTCELRNYLAAKRAVSSFTPSRTSRDFSSSTAAYQERRTYDRDPTGGSADYNPAPRHREDTSCFCYPTIYVNTLLAVVVRSFPSLRRRRRGGGRRGETTFRLGSW